MSDAGERVELKVLGEKAAADYSKLRGSGV